MPVKAPVRIFFVFIARVLSGYSFIFGAEESETFRWTVFTSFRRWVGGVHTRPRGLSAKHPHEQLPQACLRSSPEIAIRVFSPHIEQLGTV